MSLKKTFLFLFAVFLFAVSVYAEYNSFGIPDSSEIRKKLNRECFEAPLEVIRTLPSEFYKNSIGIEFQLRVEELDDSFIVIVAPETDENIEVHDASGVHIQEGGVYTVDAPGSWILVRDKKNGDPILIRYYFAQDKEVYVQFRPNKISGNRKAAYADLMIFGSYVARAVQLGVPFEKFYTASFAEVQALTKKTLPWNYVMPSLKHYVKEEAEQKKFEEENPEEAKLKKPKKIVNPARIYDDSLVMIQTIRENLKDIVYVEDAIYDEFGNPVSLLNGKPRIVKEEHKDKITLCSQGFLKWVVDGIVEPIAGGYLKREPLLEETVELNPISYQGTMAVQYNTYNGLDWTRNLAVAVLSCVSGRKILYKNSGVDVTLEPFAAMVTEKGILNTTGHIKNSGYKISYLKQLLYVLAAKNPGYFYLAAIRQSDRQSDKKLEIETKVFNDCAIVFPYFDINGKFRTVVFYDGNEYNLEDFFNSFSPKNRDDIFIHLTRVKTTSKYYPQTIKKEQKND